MENLFSEVIKLESEVAISRNITTVLSERLVQMERQWWANAQYSQRECEKIVGIPGYSSLEDSVSKTFDKLNCNVKDKDNLEDCHRLKTDRVIVKFPKRKDCNQVLRVKNDLKNINMTGLGFE